MAGCVPVPEKPTLTESMLVCNTIGCTHMSGPSQPLLCDCCEAKMPKLNIRYAEKSGPDIFACGHEEKPGDFGMTGHFGCMIDRATKCPDCLGWERGDRVAMVKERIRRLQEAEEPTPPQEEQDHR